jgi:uncharacterized protein YjaG (DUF416 family)
VAEGHAVDASARARDYLTRCEEGIPDTEDFDGGGVSSALDASVAIAELLDCIARLGTTSAGADASAHAALSALAALDTADMIDERRPDGKPLATAAERARQAELTRWIEAGMDPDEYAAKARALGAIRDLILGG